MCSIELELLELAEQMSIAVLRVRQDARSNFRCFKVCPHIFYQVLVETAKSGNSWAQSWDPNSFEWVGWMLNNVLSMAQHAAIGYWCGPSYNSFEFVVGWNCAKKWGTDLDAVSVIRLYLEKIGRIAKNNGARRFG